VERFADSDLVVLGLNQEEDVEREAEVARELELPWPVLLGMQPTFRDYWIAGIPDTILIDRNGVLRRRWVGFGECSIEEISAAIEKLLAEER
jgi:hypothetical protein